MVGKLLEEKSFPRGAQPVVKPLEPVTDNVPKVDKKKEKDLFSNKEQKVVKKKKAKKKEKNKSIFDVSTVGTLSYSQLSEGQVLLGFISQVLEFELKISLPGHLVGTVPITNISTTYTTRLREAADTTEDQDDDLPPLNNLYSEGDMVATSVVSVSKEGSRYSVILSMAPTRLLGGRLPGVGELCTASVESKEDHGYIMDIGSNTVRGFVPNKAMAKVGDAEVGKVMWCVVTRAEAGVRSMTPVPGKVWSQECTNPTVHNLYPATKVKAKVDGLLENGLKLSFGSGLVGYVHSDQLKDQDDFVEGYTVGSEVEARVLYITPTVNTIMLTLRELKQKDMFKDLTAGQLVEGATVEKVMNNMLVIKFPSGQFGIVTVRNMKEGKEVVKNVKKRFKVGAKLTARVLALDYCSGVAVCSLQASLLAGVQRMDMLQIGELLTVTVKSWVNAGLLVTVGHNVTGMVPRLFLSDVQLSHPERKYLPGDKLPARVLRLNPEKKQLHLTTKPILVKEEFTIVKDYDTAAPGTITEGVVVKISNNGLLVQLWGDLKGWVPKSQLSTENIEYPEKLFWLGQAVKCKVLDSDRDKDRVSLTLVLDTMVPMGRKERGRQVLQLGKMYTATVVKIGEGGVEVTVVHEGKKIPAVIPINHLTDQISLASIIVTNIKEGDELECMAWQKDVVTVLTMKKSILENYATSPKSYEEYNEGSVVPGVVVLIKKFGVFLRVPHLEKLVLCPTRMLQDYFVEEGEGLLEVGQTLWAKVVELDAENEKMVVKCGADGVGWGAETMGKLVKDWLDEVNMVSGWSTHKVGDLVSGKVLKVSEFGLLVSVEGVKGVVTNSNMSGQAVVEGDTVAGVIIFVDHMAKVVEISCESSLVSRVTTKKAGQVVKDGAVLKGKVVMHKTEHSISVVLVTNPTNLNGMIGFLGTRRNVNDLAGVDQGDEGKEVSLMVHEVTSRGEVVMVLDREVRRAGEKGTKRSRSHSISEETKKDKKKKKKVDIAENQEVVNVEKPDEAMETEDNIDTSVVEMSEVKPENKKKSKKKKRDAEKETKADGVDEETEIIPTVTEKPEKLKKQKKKEKSEKSEEDSNPPSSASAPPAPTPSKDPGWDFTATSVSAPAWQAASIWSDDELDDEKENDGLDAKSHVSKAEAKRRKRVEEELAASREQRLLDGEVAQPTTLEEFERLVVASPDSSLVWVQYMALAMQGGELEVARGVAKRALQRINFRLEDERLNIFLAWLNLENTFGTEEAMAEVLKEALQCCDQFKVYSQVAAIYQQSGKISEAEKIHKVMVRKFNKEKEVWIKFGIFYYKNNKLNDGRFVLQRSLQSLEKKEHLEMSSKFAQIEFRYGDPERGKTMFETILANYPRRTDLWSVYVDQLVKTGDIDAARALFRRMATLDLQAKRMKFLFKKWLDFETGHGTESGVSEVRQAAQKYLEGKGGGGDLPTEGNVAA